MQRLVPKSGPSKVPHKDFNPDKQKAGASDCKEAFSVPAAISVPHIGPGKNRDNGRCGKHTGCHVDIVADKTPADAADECKHGDPDGLEDCPGDGNLRQMFVDYPLCECFKEHVGRDNQKQDNRTEITELLQICG